MLYQFFGTGRTPVLSLDRCVDEGHDMAPSSPYRGDASYGVLEGLSGGSVQRPDCLDCEVSAAGYDPALRSDGHD